MSPGNGFVVPCLRATFRTWLFCSRTRMEGPGGAQWGEGAWLGLVKDRACWREQQRTWGDVAGVPASSVWGLDLGKRTVTAAVTAHFAQGLLCARHATRDCGP